MKYGLIRKGPGKNSKILIYTVSLFAIILWGISYIWTNTLISLDIPVTYFVFVRILLAGFVLFLLNAASGRIAKIKKKDIPKFLLLAFFEPFIYFICESYGVKETGSPTLSAMIIATIPIFSVGAGIMFFKEKINAVNISGILLCIIGIILVVMSKGELGKHFIFGVILLLIAVISEVGHASVTKSLSGNYSSQVIVIYLSSDVWYPIICLSVLCSSLAFSLWVSTIKSLGVAKSSIFSALIPVVAAIVAWLLGHESLNARQFIGIMISALGVVLSQYTKTPDIKSGVRK